MHLILNPKFRITKQKSSIILHSARLEGTEGYIQSIPATSAIILTLYDGTRRPEDVSGAMERSGFSREVIQNVMTITQDYMDHSVLIDIKTIKNRSHIQVYDPLDFAFEAEVKPTGARLDQPIGFTYLPTLSCNRLCKYCYANAMYLKNEERIPFNRVKQIIDEASFLGVRSVNISGGEPFLRPDLTQILEYMLNKNIYPSVSTKAALPEDIIRRLSIAGLEDIQVSLDSSDPETANFLIGSANYYKQIINTIKLLVEYNIKVNLNCVVTSYNINHVQSLLNLATELGVSEVAFSAYTRSLGRHEENLFASLKDLQWLTSMLPDLRDKHPELKIHGFSSPGTPDLLKDDTLPCGLTCSVGTYGFILLPNGDVSICERLAYNSAFIMGNLNNQSITEVWSSPKWDSFCYPDKEHFEGTECFTCEAFEQCTMLRQHCYVRTMLAYGKIYAPEPSCPRIQKPDIRLA